MTHESELRAIDFVMDKLKELRKQVVKTQKVWQKENITTANKKKESENEQNYLDSLRRMTWHEIMGRQQQLGFSDGGEHIRLNVEYEDLEFERVCYGKNLETKGQYPEEVKERILNIISKNIKRGTPPRIGESIFVDDCIFSIRDITYYDEDYNIFYEIIDNHSKRFMYREDMAQRFPEIRQIYDIPRYNPNDYYKDEE